MDPIQEFANNFHEITGTRIGERQKNLNQLLNQFKKTHNNLSNNELNTLDELIKPANKLEETFKLTVFIELKHTEYLFKIFENETLFLIRKLIKVNWFFENAFIDLTGNELINKLLYKLAPITRQQIINKLGICLKNVKVAEDFFKAIKTKYGIRTAVKILPACRIDFIQTTIDENEIKLSDKQLLRIVKNDLNFIDYYFNKFTSLTHYKFDINEFKSVLNYVALKDFTKFSTFFDLYKLKINLNRKLTTKLYAERKDDVIKRPAYYLSFMHARKLISLLRDDFPEFLVNAFPNSIENFPESFTYPAYTYVVYDKDYCYTNKLIEHLPRAAKYELVRDAFYKKYHAHITDYEQFINEDLIRIMPLKERCEYAKLKLQDENKWMCYLEITEAIAVIKEKIRLYSERSTRSTYLNYLIETCKINEDDNALLDVLRYFLERHRNEDMKTRVSFLSTLTQLFETQKLSAEHWSEIRKIVKLFDLNDEKSYVCSEYLEKHMQHLFLNKTITSDDVFCYLQEYVAEKHYFYISNEVPAFQAYLITTIPDVIFKFQGDLLRKASLIYAKLIRHWKTECKKRKIEPHTEIIKIVLETNENNDDYEYASFLGYCATLRSARSFKKIALKKLWKNLKQYDHLTTPVLTQLLKHDPLIVEEYLEEIVENTRVSRNFMSALRFYAHLQLPQQFGDCYKRHFTHGRFKTKAIVALSILLPTEEYLTVMSCYTNLTETKINFDDDKITFKYQKHFVNNLKYVDRYSLTIPLLMKFCVGDYLQVSLRSLYCIVNYSPEHETAELLEELLKRSVSVRKHGLFLIASTSDLITVYRTLVGVNEKNASLRKFIFAQTFKHFTCNPCEETWELYVKRFEGIDKDDVEAYNCFAQLRAVHSKWVAQFIQFAWNCFNSSNSAEVSKKKFEFLTEISCKEIIETLPRNFNETIIRETINNEAVIEFCYQYILISSDNSQIISEILQCGEIKSVRKFLITLCTKFRKNNKLHDLQNFVLRWNEVNAPIDAYEDYLTLQFMLKFVEADAANKTSDFAKKIGSFYKENLDKYGCMIVEIFATTLKAVLQDFFASIEGLCEEHNFDFYSNLIKRDKTKYNYVLVLYLLPTTYSETKSIAKRHELLLSEISECSEPWLKLHYNRHLMNL